jgi:hypothetical protein
MSPLSRRLRIVVAVTVALAGALAVPTLASSGRHSKVLDGRATAPISDCYLAAHGHSTSRPAGCSGSLMTLLHRTTAQADTPPTPATRSTSPIGQCLAPAGVNDRCETWGSHLAAASDTSNRGAIYQLFIAQPIGATSSKDGSTVIVAGTGTQTNNDDCIVVAGLDAKTGTPRWVTRAPTQLSTDASAMAISPDGKTIYVTGYITLRPDLQSRPFNYFYTMALSATNGRVAWVKQYLGGGANINLATAIAVSPRGDKVYVTGGSQRLGPYQVLPMDWVTIAYNARSGSSLGLTRYSGAAGGQNLPLYMAVSPRGDQVVVTGVSERPTLQAVSLFDTQTISYRPNMREVWASRFVSGQANNGDAIPAGLAISPRGDRVFVSGTAQFDVSSGLEDDYNTIAYSMSGARLWSQRFRSPAGGSALVWSLASSPRGDAVYVTGWTDQAEPLIPSAVGATSGQSAVLPAMATVAYDAASGHVRWQQTYAPQGAPSAGTAIGVSPSGDRVYVGGYIGVAAAGVLVSYDLTVGYDAAKGTQAWVARYDVRDPGSLGGNLPLSIATNKRTGDVYTVADYSPLTAAAGQAPTDVFVLAYPR